MSSTLKNRKNKDTTGTTTTKEISPTSSSTKETEETPVDPTLLEPPLTNPTEQDIAELGDCVTFLKNPETDNEVYLIGTAHISEQSMQDVSRIIDKVKPHVIVIELDRSRAVLLNDNSTKEELEKFLEESLWDQVMKAFQKEKSPSSIISAVLVRFSRAMLLKLDVDPRIYGGEFKMAVAGARKYSSVLIFGDRPIQTTIQRTWSAMTWPQTFYAMWEVITNLDMSAFDDLTTEDIEELKNKDTLEFMIGKIKESMPNVYETMIGERDQFLASSLLNASGEIITLKLNQRTKATTTQQSEPSSSTSDTQDNTEGAGGNSSGSKEPEIKSREQKRRDSFNESLQKNSRMVRQGSLKKLQTWMAKKSGETSSTNDETEKRKDKGSIDEDGNTESSSSSSNQQDVDQPKLRIVGVVGAGHVPGIVNHWNGPKIDTAALLKIPKVMSIRSFVIVVILILCVVLFLLVKLLFTLIPMMLDFFNPK